MKRFGTTSLLGLQAFADVRGEDADFRALCTKWARTRLHNLGLIAPGRMLIGGGERYHITALGRQVLAAKRKQRQPKTTSKSS